MQGLLLAPVCWRDGWTSSVFKVSGSVMDSVGTLLFSDTVKKWTMQVSRGFPLCVSPVPSISLPIVSPVINSA